MAYNPQDHYFKKAKQQNYAARSVFKLEEINHKFHILKSGMSIMDLGAAPGSWSQYCSKQIGSGGKILGIDLTAISIKLPQATFIQADLKSLDLKQVIEQQGFDPAFDCVISDMAPKTTGIKITDQARSVELVEVALHTAEQFLKPGGNFVAKLFHCDEFTQLRDKMKKMFHRFEAIKPDSTRKISKEIFLIGLNKK